MKKLAVLLAICTICSARMSSALCGEPQPRLVCAEYYASQVVLEATLLKIDVLHDKDDPEGISGYFYSLKTNRVFRGNIPQLFRIYEGNDSGRASFDWKVGTKYVLFLFSSPNDKAWSLEGCGNSSPAAKADSVFLDLDRIRRSMRGGSISGMVSAQTLSNPLPHVHLLARGPTGIFEAITDQSGRFSIDVPPGEYTLEPLRSPVPLEPYVLT